MSDSTIHEFNPVLEQESGVFKVIISRPNHNEEKRPKTMDNLGINATPLLNIHIPSWRLGTPHFTLRGTPIIRGSSYAPTEDFRSSTVSMLNRPHGHLNTPLSDRVSKRPSGLSVPQGRFLRSSQPASPRLRNAMRSTYVSPHLLIDPAMFTDLTFTPACDDRSIVRYSSTTGAVTAATPARLVAEITSPSFLDYELISDFFLTFRTFIDPETLLRMLIARLRWALERQDEIGMIVRVRTFVAVRHWILNYFMDDFVLDYNLRVTFCKLLNDFVEELSRDMHVRRVQIKILAELKKCWRRICAHYWDGPDFDDTLGPEVPITTGGIAGYRDPNLDPAFWEREGIEPPPMEMPSPLTKHSIEAASFYAEPPKTAGIGDFIVLGDRPGTPEHQPNTDVNRRNGPNSPLSIASMDIISCSFPSKTLRALNPNSSRNMGAHPVYSTSPISQSGTIATTPKALVGKRVRPTQTHKRNNSLTDSMREHNSDKSSTNDHEAPLPFQSAGSLVRGNMLPPGHAYVEVNSGSHTGEGNRQTTIFQPQTRGSTKGGILGGAMSGNGMKKLLSSVRRALSNRSQLSSPTQPNFMNVSPMGPRGATTNRLPGTAVVPQGRTRQNGTRPPVRIDLLGAEVAEDFKKAIREEEAAAEAGRLGMSIPAQNSAPAIPEHLEYSAAHMDFSTFDCLPHNQKARPVSDMGITTGSKSIVIFDDTVPFDTAPLSGGLPILTPSAEELVDAFIPNGGDPTPPNTPPTYNVGGTPTRSSYLLNQEYASSGEPHDPLPPFIPDLDTLQGSCDSRRSEELGRPSLSAIRRGQRRPLLSGGTFRMHRRYGSGRTHQSYHSVLRRHASFSSGVYPPSTIRSFDATTQSGASFFEDEATVPVPEPLRVLRRRPGGDLRAATNVGDLDYVPIRKSRSVGSLTAYSESLRDSHLLSIHADARVEPEHMLDVTPEEPPITDRQVAAFSVGQLADKPPKRDLSLFSTHSSKPIMRPSFEKEAQKLAQIPDDEDDGGIESALLKLEGKFESKPTRSPSDAQAANTDNEDQVAEKEESVAAANYWAPDDEEVESGEHYLYGGRDESLAEDRNGHFHVSGHFNHQPGAVQPYAFEPRSFLSEASRESYCSIPLLDRGLTDDGRSKRATNEWTDKSILRESLDNASMDESGRKLYTVESVELPHSSFDFVEKTSSIQKIAPGQSLPTEYANNSFLDDNSTKSTDLSSELSVEDANGLEISRRGAGAGFNAVAETATCSTPPQPPHPFGDPMCIPVTTSSTPLTLSQALEMQPNQEPQPQQSCGQHLLLPHTPDTTLLAAHFHCPISTAERLRSVPKLDTGNTDNFGNTRKFSVHLPFILAFDSDILAQQFTLIEKDALNEIDWKELIDMNWKNATSNDSRSWVDFLRNSDAHGVEVVIARFNIMVKWAISEIVLTQRIEERARCIIKYIHIAAHCRRYRNFATLAQLTIALSSNEVGRLSKTWDLVPAHDLAVLAELEILVTPTRNFYSLRAEMETGSDSGCIPFVGIYTHDLLYNAQRPSEIASSPTTAPLVNFERCRIGAAVVKTLLRLLEASTRYTFQPIEGVTERCLWMGALSDEEIRKHSESLE